MKSLPKYIVNTLLAATAAFSSIFCITTGFDIPVNEFAVILAALISAMIFNGCFMWKKALFLLIPVGLFLGGLIFFTDTFSVVGTTLVQLIHDILTRFSTAYPNFSFAIPGEPEVFLPRNITLTFSLIAAALSVWMAWGVGYRSCLISVAGTLPFLLLCVIINDTPPHALPLTLLLIVWVTVLLSKERLGEPPIMDAVRVVLVLMAVSILLGTVAMVYPKGDTRDQELPELVQDFIDLLPEPLQSMLEREDNTKPAEQLGADTSTVLDLTQQGIRERKDTLMLQISTTKVGPIYLRGAAKDIYTGTSWESSDMASSADSVYAHTSLGTAFGTTNQAAVQIQNVGDNVNVLFMPYGFISCTSAEDIVSDLRVNINEEDYIVYYWPDVFSLDLAESIGYVNESYDNYVMETCLSLPSQTKTELYELAISYGYDPEMTVPETVAWVATFIRNSGVYKLDVPRQPVNHDFAVYFLTESNQGYCVHYATAAAAMYRALGIPARYASGYRVTVPSSGIIVDVLDRDTHAWAEVYISGLGWIPVETTPGFGQTSQLPQVQQPTEPSPSPSPTPTPEPAEPSPSEVPASPSPSEAPASPSEDPAAPTDGENAEGAQPPAEPTAQEKAIKLLFPILGVVLTAILVLMLRRMIISLRRKRLFRHKHPNQAVLNMWQYLEKLSRWGAVIPKELEELALKAKFSPHTITAQELNSCTASVYHLAEKTKRSQKGLRRWRFKWIACLNLRQKPQKKSK